MEFWSTGVLRIVGIAPRVRGVGRAFKGRVHSQSPLVPCVPLREHDRWSQQIRMDTNRRGNRNRARPAERAFESMRLSNYTVDDVDTIRTN